MGRETSGGFRFGGILLWIHGYLERKEDQWLTGFSLT